MLRLYWVVERQEVIKRVEKAVQRRKAADKDNTGHFPRAKPTMNIWGLVIDTMTRAHSIDHMPEVIKTLRNFNNGDRYRTFLFSSANMAGPSGTAPNMGPMFGGKAMVPYWPMRKYLERWMRNPYLVDPKTGEFSESGKESPWLWDHLANEGYVTSHTGFFSDIIGVRTWNASALDHEMPSIVPVKDKNGLCNNHEYDTGSCKGEKTMAQYHMDYSKEFFTKSYKGMRKFSYSHFDEPHHIKKHACQLNKAIPSAIEEVLAADNDMFLIVASDHGSRADSICHQVLLSFTVPTWFLKENPTVEKNLFHNQLQLVSFWDVYQTMKHVASFPARPPVLEWEKGQQSPRGSSSTNAPPPVMSAVQPPPTYLCWVLFSPCPIWPLAHDHSPTYRLLLMLLCVRSVRENATGEDVRTGGRRAGRQVRLRRRVVRGHRRWAEKGGSCASVGARQVQR
eukprot:COSAG05_NODE_483_length_9358_cov_36.727184_5_plen_451_part_00